MKLSLKSPQIKILYRIGWIVLCLSAGLFCFIKVYKESFHLYQTPSQALHSLPRGSLRIGGKLRKGTLLYQEEHISFELTDENDARLAIIFYGTPPRLLKEDQDTIVFGHFEEQIFIATEVLAKHDEYYRPKS